MDRKLDIIYDYCDTLMDQDNFQELNRKLGQLAISSMDTDILLGWITATLPAKTKLKNRKRLVKAAKIRSLPLNGLE